MPSQQADAGAPSAKRPARDLIDAVVENMRGNLEVLKYSTLAPSRYLVYLHPAEHARLEGIIPVLQDQTIRALAEELERLNKASVVGRLVDRLARRARTDVRNAGCEWHVEFMADSDGELREGDLLVDSTLVLPARPELGVGGRTRRITTVHTGQQTTVREQSIASDGTGSAAAVLARLAYDDDAGRHRYDITRDSLAVGRGGLAFAVDVKIASSADVSREHVRLRRDPASGVFFLIDLSSLGTTLNGRHVPRGYDEVDGARRENGRETPLPDRARIGLADTVFLDFTRVR